MNSSWITRNDLKISRLRDKRRYLPNRKRAALHKIQHRHHKSSKDITNSRIRHLSKYQNRRYYLLRETQLSLLTWINTFQTIPKRTESAVLQIFSTTCASTMTGSDEKIKTENQSTKDAT